MGGGARKTKIATSKVSMASAEKGCSLGVEFPSLRFLYLTGA